jgi:hypothetical protein
MVVVEKLPREGARMTIDTITAFNVMPKGNEVQA